MATATYLERRDLIESSVFAKRLQVAVWNLASETLVSGTTPQKTWATNTLKGATSVDVLRRVAIKVAADSVTGPLGEAATDAQIQTVVDAMLTDLSA